MPASSFTHADIVRAVDTLENDLFAFASRLVRTPSLPGEAAAAQSHPAFCDDGIPVEQRVNVVGRWPGRAGSEEGAAGRSLILNGHLDVVPPGDEALWSDSPWSGRIRDGRLYGRGSCDMKAGLTAAIFAVEALQAGGRGARAPARASGASP